MRRPLVSLALVVAVTAAACDEAKPPVSDAPMAPDAGVDGTVDPPDARLPDAGVDGTVDPPDARLPDAGVDGTVDPPDARLPDAAMPVTLTVATTGTGAGTVTSTPAGIDCGATCTAPFNAGSAITLGATPSTESTFTGWSGGGCSGTGSCTVTLAASTTVTATFTLDRYTLTVAKTGTGASSGTITSSPAGITCGTTCSATYDHGTMITLTAGGGGATFTGWSGAGCTGTGTCVITVTAAVTATATFEASPNIAFVTSTVHSGNLGGLAGADAICQARANAVSLGGTYRAWLSTSAIGASARFAGASGWVRTDGKPFANTIAQLVAGQIYYPLILNESGSTIFSSAAWTGTDASGALSGVACANWLDGTSDVAGTIGLIHAGSDDWTAWSSVAQCSGLQPLYCLGVDSATTVTPPPVTAVRRAFLTSAPWIPNGGLAGADALCTSEATAAGLPGTYRALLATTGTTAASRFSTAGNPWARVDDVILAPTAAGFLGTPFLGPPRYWQAALNVTAEGAYRRDQIWAGGASPQSSANVPNCNGWSTADGTAHGAVGLAWWSEVGGAFAYYLSPSSGITNCNNTQRKLMCLQQ